MYSLLLQPFPKSGQAGSRILTALFFGLFVFLFLLIFRPFGLQEMRTASLAQAAFLYGLVCILVLLGGLLFLPRLFPSLFAEQGWTVWKEILHITGCVLAVTAGNILFTHYYFGEALNGNLILKFGWITLSVAIFPITLLVLTRQLRLMKAYSRQAALLDRQLEGPGPAALNGLPPEITFSSENGQENFCLPLHSFLYAEAADNYVKVVYWLEEKQAQKIIRSSLKKLEEGWKGHDRLYRCHRTYIVNLEKVVHISGNAQGYKLHFEGITSSIPVSRALNKEIACLVSRPNFP
ncbi:MAG: LytTR family DNA-binding domain-containing protein, partial [Bacteroidota bacterium]